MLLSPWNSKNAFSSKIIDNISSLAYNQPFCLQKNFKYKKEEKK